MFQRSCSLTYVPPLVLRNDISSKNSPYDRFPHRLKTMAPSMAFYALRHYNASHIHSKLVCYCSSTQVQSDSDYPHFVRLLRLPRLRLTSLRRSLTSFASSPHFVTEHKDNLLSAEIRVKRESLRRRYFHKHYEVMRSIRVNEWNLRFHE